MDPTSAIARVVTDLRRGRIVNPHEERTQRDLGSAVNAANRSAMGDSVVIDVTPVSRMLAASNLASFDPYEAVLAPPWAHALMMCCNDTGSVWAVGINVVDRDDGERWAWDNPSQQWPPIDGRRPIAWCRLRWMLVGFVYVGGSLDGVPQPTAGPVRIWRIGVYADGSLATINDAGSARWDVTGEKALATVLETLNLCNCVNIEIVERSDQDRAQRRRLQRLGVALSEIHVRPTATSVRGSRLMPLSELQSAHGVRGHYATYGSGGRGLLFGKYSGRYWISPHVRGRGDRIEQTYVVGELS